MSKQYFDYYQPRKRGQGEAFPTARRDTKRTIGFDEAPTRKKHRRQASDEGFHGGRLGGGRPAPSKRRWSGAKSAPPEDLQEQKPKKRWLRRILWTFLILFFIALLAAGWVGWKFFNETTKVFGGTAFSNAVRFFQPTQLEGEGDGHVNLLIAGTSVDDPGHGGADLTDSIMILSVNTQTKQGYLFSIPRDLWVEIPGEGHHKINEAYHWGKENNFQDPDYPPGGMGLLEKTIEQSFGVPIHYNALVNYTAVKNVVNAIGGVDVTINSSDPRGLYDPNISYVDGGPLQLPNGVNHLDGQTALNLTRARGGPTMDGRVAYGFPRSDFDRAEHQRQLLAAIQAKMSSSGVFLNPFKLGKVLDAIGTNVTTDMQINEARKLVNYVRQIGTNNLQPVALVSDSKNYLRSYGTPTGQAALIPAAGIDDFSDIQAFIQPLLGVDKP